MKILMTGGGGQIAWEVKQQAKKHKVELVALEKRQLDITHAQAVKELISLHHPDLVINTAAYTAVDKAESEKTLAFKINCDGAGLIAQCCDQFKIPLIHLSTDYVFDGNTTKAYLEDDTPHPLGIYGDSKLQGECEIKQQLTEHIILRVSGVFGVHGNNFVKTMLRLGKERDTLNIVADQITCLTAAQDIAETLLSIAKQVKNGNPVWGTYHYCGQPAVSWHQFATEIFEIAKQYTPLKISTLKAINVVDYPTAAIRPKHSVLDCQKIVKVFGIEQPNWRDGLGKVVKMLLLHC